MENTIIIIIFVILLIMILNGARKFYINIYDNITNSKKDCNDCPYYKFYMEHRKDS